MRKIVIAIAATAACAGLVAWRAEPPSVGDLQRAYDREASFAGADHDEDVVIVGADCSTDGETRYVCQVGFKRSNENSERVYLDGALLERENGQWKLLRGLCRRLI